MIQERGHINKEIVQDFCPMKRKGILLITLTPEMYVCITLQLLLMAVIPSFFKNVILTNYLLSVFFQKLSFPL